MAVSTFGSDNVTPGEKTVGNGVTVLSTASKPCNRVWIGAPTSNHPKGSVNTGTILIGTSALNTSAAGAMVLTSDNADGIHYHVANANQVYLKGFNAGDAVEYQIFS